MTTDCHDPVTEEPLDEFWGDQTDWPTVDARPDHTPTPRPSRIGAAAGRLWQTLTGAGIDAERRHGPTSRSDALPPIERDVERDVEPELSAVDRLGAAWDLEPEPRPMRGPGVDPLLARLGALAVIVTVAVPVVLGFTSDSTPDTTQVRTEAPAPPADRPATSPTSSNAQAVAVEPDTIATTAPAATPAPGPAPDPASAAGSAAAVAPPSSAGALVGPQDASVSTAEPACGSRYELAAGDYWIRIADAADVALSDLLAVNDASVDTVLVPGRSICLPVGASTPVPPTTAARSAPTAVAPTPASRPTASSSVAPTTAAPAPTTTVPARPAAVSTEEAVAIIRSVWPDDLEERAIEIAWRESKHQSNVNNWCCYGLFQIHWNAHRSWLASLGITSATQLYDPTVNATAAYTLYQRAGGFGPWGG